jgi:hypothetical protein
MEFIATARPRSLKGTEAVSWFRKLVMWFTQTLSIWDKIGQATTWGTCGLCRSHLQRIQGIRSDGPGEASNIIYWPKTLFSGGTTHSYEVASPWLPSQEVGLFSTNMIQGRRGSRGCLPQGSPPSRAATGLSLLVEKRPWILVRNCH